MGLVKWMEKRIGQIFFWISHQSTYTLNMHLISTTMTLFHEKEKKNFNQKMVKLIGHISQSEINSLTQNKPKTHSGQTRLIEVL